MTNNNPQKNLSTNGISKKLNAEFELNQLPDDLKISTMTIICNLNTLINIENVGKYISLNHGGIVCIKYGNGEIRTLIKLKKTNKNNVKNKKNFYNQATLVVDVKNKRRVNVKLFKNGAVQLTGCKNIENFIDAMEIICNELTKTKAVYNKTDCKIIRKEFVTKQENTSVENIYNFKISMINSNFHIGFIVNREILYEILTKSGIRSSYEPCIHACVNIKYNYKNQEMISIFVFESGSIIITGAKNTNHIIESYKFITKILYENYDKIVKNDIDKFLEKPEIKELINKNQQDSAEILITI
jgi:TATA-box binding protein (TBP) (component of TFIID and TFIIIB)